MRTVSFVCALLALGLSLVAVMAQAPRGPKSDFLAALDTAQEMAPGGQLLLGRLEKKGGKDLFGFYYWLNGRIKEIEFTKKGGVEKVEEKGEDTFNQAVLDALRSRKGAKIPFAQYIEVASDKIKGGDPTRIELTADKGKLHVLVDVTSGDKTMRVDIDLADGRVVKVTETRSQQ